MLDSFYHNFYDTKSTLKLCFWYVKLKIDGYYITLLNM